MNGFNSLKKTALALSVSLLAGAASAESIIVQSTTSTKNSGLYDYLLPLVEADTGVKVNYIQQWKMASSMPKRRW